VDSYNNAIDDYNNATQALEHTTYYRDVLTLDNVDTRELVIDTDECENIETHSLHQYVRAIDNARDTLNDVVAEYNQMLRVIQHIQSNIDFVRKYVPLLIDNINRITYIITNAYDDSERRDVLQQQQTLKNAFVDDYMYTHGIYTIDNALQHCQSWYNETHEQIKDNGNK
jgi:exonuclease VII small subunit